MVKYTPIQGTNSWADIPVRLSNATSTLWWEAGSAWTEGMKTLDLELLSPDDPFRWDTDLGGVFWRPKLRDWMAAGWNLKDYFLRPNVPLDDINLVAHSHGLQVVLFACAYGLTVRNLISCGSPVRQDMMKFAKIARQRIGTWLHISDPSDKTQRDGEFFDEHFGIVRKHPFADVNHSQDGINHSNILYDPTYFHFWKDNGWADYLRLKWPKKIVGVEVTPQQNEVNR